MSQSLLLQKSKAHASLLIDSAPGIKASRWSINFLFLRHNDFAVLLKSNTSPSYSSFIRRESSLSPGRNQSLDDCGAGFDLRYSFITFIASTGQLALDGCALNASRAFVLLYHEILFRRVSFIHSVTVDSNSVAFCSIQAPVVLLKEAYPPCH